LINTLILSPHSLLLVRGGGERQGVRDRRESWRETETESQGERIKGREAGGERRGRETGERDSGREAGGERQVRDTKRERQGERKGIETECGERGVQREKRARETGRE